MISATKTRKLVSMVKIEKNFHVKKAFLSMLVLFFVLKNTSAAPASSDFYGVKMMSEYHAKDLVVDESGPSPIFSVDKPGMDKRIYATASLSGRNIKIQIFNHSDETIISDTDTTEYVVVTHDGERHTLKPQPMAWASSHPIAPNKSATFDPSFVGPILKKSDIRVLICSFDLGEMKIILLPLTKKYEELQKDTTPAPKSKTVEVKKASPKKAEEKKPVETKKPAPKKIEEKKLPQKKLEVKPPAPTPEPKKIAAVEPPKKTTEFSEAEKKLLDQYEKSRKSRKYWHVEEIRQGFIVINLGANDGLKPGASVQIAREGAFVAQAPIRQLSPGYATASVPPDAAVQAGDDVLFFGATA